MYIYNYCDIPDAGYFAVFDGHAGASAAKWCSEHLHEIIKNNILKNEGIHVKGMDGSNGPNSGPGQSQASPKEKKKKWFTRKSSTSSSSSSSSSVDADKSGHKKSASGGGSSGSHSLTGQSPIASANSQAIDNARRNRRKSSSASSTLSVSSNGSNGSNGSSPGSQTNTNNAHGNPVCSKPIPKNQRVPLAFRTAFLEADAAMAKNIPAHTGTTAAVAVVRWEAPEAEALDGRKDLQEKDEEEEREDKKDDGDAPKEVDQVSKDLGGLSVGAGIQKDPAPVLVEPGQSGHQPVPAQPNPAPAEPPHSRQSSSQPAPSSASPSHPAPELRPDASTPLSKVTSSVSTSSSCSFLHSVTNPTHRRRFLYAANVGDARVVLCRGGKALRLTYDHKGSDPHEQARVTGAGGLMIGNRVNGMLAVTRSLGDGYMKSLVTGLPYTTRTELSTEDEFVIVACDGLWDVCSDQEAVELVREVADPKVAAKMLVSNAIKSYSSDNITCMVIRLDPSVCV